MIPYYILLALCIFSLSSIAQGRKSKPVIPETYCVSADELHLYRLINEYRLTFGLEIIPFSRSLSFVAHTHVRDLHAHRPDLFGCNLHSWSANGKWTPCCYARDPNRTNCMWDKPRELTSYRGNGHEMIFWENVPATPRSAFDQWRNLEATNDMLLNRGRWQDEKWLALGVSIFEGYASLWFGEVEDRELQTRLCGSSTELSRNWLIDELNKAQQVNAEIPEKRYYLIVSSFNNMAQAESEVVRLKAGGYENARVIEKDNNFRVSVYDFTDPAQAQQKRRQLFDVFRGIWVLEK